MKTKTIVGIDPGNTHSALVAIRDGHIVHSAYLPNDEFRRMPEVWRGGSIEEPLVVCEMIASYGMAVGKSVFETCVFVGRLMQKFPGMRRVTRLDVKVAICKSAKAKDANIRTALIDIYGPPGTKKMPGGTYGIAGDMWAALAVAHAYSEGVREYDPSATR